MPRNAVEIRAQYEMQMQGYTVLRRTYRDESYIKRIADAIDRLEQKAPPHHIFYERDGKTVRRIENAADLCVELDVLCGDASWLATLINAKIMPPRKCYDRSNADRIRAWEHTTQHLRSSESQLPTAAAAAADNLSPLWPRVGTDKPVHIELTDAIPPYAKAEYVLFKDKVNFKRPGGAGFPAHLDGHFGVDRGGWRQYSEHFVSALICIDKMTAENGALEIAPIDHQFKWERCIADGGGGGPNITKEYEDELPFRLVELDPGDVLLFDWRCAHRSAPNRTTDKPRRTVYATYYARAIGDNTNQRAVYYADKRNSKQTQEQKSLLSSSPSPSPPLPEAPPPSPSPPEQPHEVSLPPFPSLPSLPR